MHALSVMMSNSNVVQALGDKNTLIEGVCTHTQASYLLTNVLVGLTHSLTRSFSLIQLLTCVIQGNASPCSAARVNGSPALPHPHTPLHRYHACAAALQQRPVPPSRCNTGVALLQ